MPGTRQFCQGGGGVLFVLVTKVFHRRPMGPIASRGMFVSEFLRKPIATCDFPGGGGGGEGGCPPSRSAQVAYCLKRIPNEINN